MSTRVLLGIAALAVAGLLVGLWMMISPMSSEAAQPAKTGKTPKETVAEATPTQTPSSSARKATIPTAPPTRKPAAPTTDPWAAGRSGGAAEAPAAAAPADPAEEKRLAMRGLLRTQQLATEQMMNECMEKRDKSEELRDGVLAFPLVVSRGKDGKIVTESSSIDYSTIGSGSVTNCMAGVMKKMAYEELPDGVSKVTSYRKITIKDGAIVEDWMGPHETVDTKPER